MKQCAKQAINKGFFEQHFSWCLVLKGVLLGGFDSVSIMEHIFTNLDGIANYTPKLYDINHVCIYIY